MASDAGERHAGPLCIWTWIRIQMQITFRIQLKKNLNLRMLLASVLDELSRCFSPFPQVLQFLLVPLASVPAFCLTGRLLLRPPPASLIGPEDSHQSDAFCFVTLFSFGKASGATVPGKKKQERKPGRRQLLRRRQPTATILHRDEEFTAVLEKIDMTPKHWARAGGAASPLAVKKQES